MQTNALRMAPELGHSKQMSHLHGQECNPALWLAPPVHSSPYCQVHCGSWFAPGQQQKQHRAVSAARASQPAQAIGSLFFSSPFWNANA